MNRKLGLVFSGGGGKGSYEIGVWKALEKFNITKHIRTVSGSSVGALNTALFLQGDYKKAKSVWLKINQEKILSLDYQKDLKNSIRDKFDFNKSIDNYIFGLKGYGIFSRSGLIDIIDNNLDLDLISNSDISGYCTCFKSTFPSQTEYLKLNGLQAYEIKNILLASSAIPIVFDNVKINGNLYMDGGIGDNVPINPAYLEGCNFIIVVHLNRDSIINKSKFSNSTIVELFPQNDLGSFLSGTLNFSPHHILKRINEGYRDTCNIMESITNFLKTDEKRINLHQEGHNNELLFKNEHISNNEKTNKLKEILQEKKNELYR